MCVCNKRGEKYNRFVLSDAQEMWATSTNCDDGGESVNYAAEVANDV